MSWGGGENQQPCFWSSSSSSSSSSFYSKRGREGGEREFKKRRLSGESHSIRDELIAPTYLLPHQSKNQSHPG